ncbi:MAG TPA: hypothetical protein VNZ86_08910 [Bacteroidia bacterium]|jgi:hypothetical protein|nr:hypothetical protein [Bacteroidia bacterium]
MRIVATIPHPSIRISIFHMNEKYMVKLEAGPMEQTFKFEQGEVTGPEEIERIMDTEFMQKALERFNEMYLSFRTLKQQASGNKQV